MVNQMVATVETPAKSFLRTLLAVRSRGHTPLPSLRLWLQSTILLAVVAGYSTLYAFSSVLMNDERANRHRQLVSMLQRELSSGTDRLAVAQRFWGRSPVVERR